MSVSFSVEYLQADYLFVSTCGAVLAQLFQASLTLFKNSDFWKNHRKILWKNPVKHICSNSLTFWSFISDGKVGFCLQSLQLIYVMLYFCHLQIEKMFQVQLL